MEISLMTFLLLFNDLKFCKISLLFAVMVTGMQFLQKKNLWILGRISKKSIYKEKRKC